MLPSLLELLSELKLPLLLHEGTVGYGTSVIEGATATTTEAGFGVEGGDNEGTVGYGTSVIEGAGAGAAFSTGAAFGAEATTTTTEAGFGVEGGDNEGTVGYGTSVIEGAGASSGKISAVSTTGFETTTTNFGAASSSVVGLPTVPSTTLTSTISPDYLPGPYISAADENPVV